MRYTIFLSVFAIIAKGVVTTDLTALWKTPKGNLNNCLRNNLEESLKLIFVKEALVSLDGFDLKLWNHNITRMDEFEIIQLHSTDDYVFKVEAFFPYCEGMGSYTVKGHAYDLDFDNTGRFSAYATNLKLYYAVKLNVAKYNGIPSLTMDYQEIKITNPEGELYVYLDNVYAGNLGKTVLMNRVLNEHSLEMYDLLVPILEEHLSKHIAQVLEDQGIIME